MMRFLRLVEWEEVASSFLMWSLELQAHRARHLRWVSLGFVESWGSSVTVATGDSSTQFSIFSPP